ncbi:MAG: single-stranded-DNA-specific exonuclease RecJ [Bacillota bacterium]
MGKRIIWRVRQADPALVHIFQHELGVSPVVAGLLANRGLSTVREAGLFLAGGLEDMYDPLGMADMDEAVRRIKFALDKGEKILIYGDYDADGTTAAAIMVKVVGRLGGAVDYYIPHRLDNGYGLHLEALRRAKENGFGLVVTVDCGISAVEEVELNKEEKGPDIVITDHHEPPEILPAAVAVVNPRRSGCPYRFKDLAGVGVALKLAQALLKSAGRDVDAWTGYLDLACLGTVADIVPLLGENRIIVKYGLSALAASRLPGIRSLVAVAGIKPENLGAREVGYALAPRLNAAGRMGDPHRAVELFLSEDREEADGLARLLNQTNQERQRTESLVLAGAMGMLDACPELAAGRVIVLASSGWHQGVIGIVASRLVDKYYKPVLIITAEGAAGKGSGRSIPGFHLYDALKSCEHLLDSFGGHAQAAGFSLPMENVDALRSALNNYAARFGDDLFVPVMELDAAVSAGDIDESLVHEIQAMAPFGYGNPEPLLAIRGAGLKSCREIGKNGGHLKVLVGENGVLMDGIGFRLASCAEEVAAAAEVDVAFSPAVNEWRGRRSVQLQLKDIRPASDDWELSGPRCAGDAQDAMEPLRRIGPLAYLPEFVSSVLNRFHKDWLDFLFPVRCHCFFPERKLPAAGHTGLRPRMIYEGRREYKPGRLLSLTAGGSGSLVVVNSPGRSVEVAAFLNNSGIPSLHVHSGMLPEEAGKRVAAFLAGEARVLVCTYGTPAVSALNPARTVCYGIPYCFDDLAAILSNGSDSHFLFGREDIRDGVEYLESLAPGRDRLADLYTYLAGLNGRGNFDATEAVEYLYAKGLARAGLHTLAFGLSVFSELGLVDLRRANGCSEVRLRPVSGKKDLNLSGFFRSGQEIKARTRKWWENLCREQATS